MNEFEIGSFSVEDFLAEERRKIEDDRKILDFIQTILKDEQQICSDSLNSEGVPFEFTLNNEILKGTDSSNGNVEPVSSKIPTTYNYQEEKERLAFLFENAPNFLNLRTTPKKHNRNEFFNSADKENQDPVCSCRSNSKILSLQNGNGRITENNNNVGNMVRVGEFSPKNPASNSFDRSLFGLGEYEGRRRAFLEKKKREYMEYLSKMKKNRSERSRNKTSSLKSNVDDECISRSPENSPSREVSEFQNKIITADGVLIEDLDIDHCYTRMQQQNYRKELDEQIKEKEKLEQERRKCETLECQKNQDKDVQQRREVMKRIEDDFNRRLKTLNDCKRETESNKINEAVPLNRGLDTSSHPEQLSTPENERLTWNLVRRQRSLQSNEPFAKQNIETCSIEDVNAYDKMKKELYRKELRKQMYEKRELEKQLTNSRKLEKNYQTDTTMNSQVPHYLGNPFMKQSAESCKIDDLGEYQRKKNELYKEELKKQIEEKRMLEIERKAKVEEAERKLEEKFRKDEEKRLTNERGREKTKENCQISQESKGDTSRVQELFENKENVVTKKFPSNPSMKVPSSHKFPEKKALRNVSFAPQTFVYSINHEENSPRTLVQGKSTQCSSDGNESVIIEAPYVLAVKNITKSVNTDHDCNRKKSTSPECLPILPDVNEPIPEIANLPIPSAVSMSEQAVREYFKTNAFTDLSQIRKMLKERQAKLN